MLNQETVAARLNSKANPFKVSPKNRDCPETPLKNTCVKKTVRRNIKEQTPNPANPTPFKGYIHSRIEAAAPDWIPAAVPYREIFETGFQGKVRIVSGYVATLKPKPDNEPALRFETQPGRQMRADFTVIRRGSSPLKAFVATLGYSRANCVRFYGNKRAEAWIDGLRNSFEFFCGIAHKVLFDNAKTVMIQRDAYAEGMHRWNPMLLAAANDYSFLPKVCRPYRAKTKGKVERFNRYLKSGFIVPLQATLRCSGLLSDVQTANGYIGKRLSQTADARVHGTTGKIPDIRLIQEQEFLLPLPLPMRVGSLPLPMKNGIVPIESLQHPLSMYDRLSGGVYESAI